MPTGRPTKLTPTVQERIVSLLRIGSTKTTAALLAGVSFDSFRKWEIRGGAEKSGLYFNFLVAVKRAEAELQALCLHNIRTALQDEDATIRLRASEWFLSHKWPEAFSQNRKIELQIEQTTRTIIEERRVLVHTIYEDPETRELALKLADRLLAQGGDPG